MRPPHGRFSGVDSVNAAFRSAIGISLLFHAAAFGSVLHVMDHRSAVTKQAPAHDVWVGTTVNVETESKDVSVPSSPENSQTADAKLGSARALGFSAPASAAHPRPASRAAPTGESVTSKSSSHEMTANVSKAKAPSDGATRQSSEPPAASVDLKQAMLDSSNQKNAATGVFGAVGVDLFRERRLPRAITRAMPQAISGEPKWWAHPVGTLGKIRFDVMLDEGGKIQEIRIDDESGHSLLARVVRRAGRVLSINHFALSEGAENTWQRFELKLDSEQVAPASDELGENGDTFSMGYEAPTGQEPGRAHIQDATGKRMRAMVRVLQPARHSPPVPSEPSAVPE